MQCPNLMLKIQHPKLSIPTYSFPVYLMNVAHIIHIFRIINVICTALLVNQDLSSLGGPRPQRVIYKLIFPQATLGCERNLPNRLLKTNRSRRRGKGQSSPANALLRDRTTLSAPPAKFRQRREVAEAGARRANGS